MDYDAYRSARRLEIGRASAELLLPVRSAEGVEMVARYVPAWGLIPDNWGWRNFLAGEETVYFYECRSRPKREGGGEVIRPYMPLPPASIERRRLKNGALRLSPGRPRSGAPKRNARKLPSEAVETILVWLPEARRLSGVDYRRAVRKYRREHRAQILALWHQRGAVRFSPRAVAATRPSGLAERLAA